jgi:HEAT repeat protein
MKELAMNHPEEVGNDILPLLTKALADPDEEVRVHASEIFYRVAFQARSKVAYGKQPVVNLSSYRPAKDVLTGATKDTNATVRKNAVSTLALAFESTREIEDLLAEQFNLETSAQVRIAIIQAIVLSGYSSSRTISVLIKALDDENSEVQGWAAKPMSMLRPPSALPKLIKGLVTPDTFARNNFLNAILAYGTTAKLYLPQLKQTLESVTDEAVRQTLNEAIERIDKIPG